MLSYCCNRHSISFAKATYFPPNPVINSTAKPLNILLIMVDSVTDKIKSNYNGEFYDDYNGFILLNIGAGLNGDSSNKIAIEIFLGTTFDNNRLNLNISCLINNNFDSIAMDNKQRLELK